MTPPYLTQSHLVAFLYELMRDHVNPATLEGLVARDEEFHRGAVFAAYSLTDAELAQRAEAVAALLLRP